MADQKPISESFPKDKEMATAHEETAVAPGAIASEAKQAADAEQNMTVLQAIKAYPKAIAWSVLLSSTLIMEGYDLALLGNLYGNSHFTKYFGEFHEASGKYVISAAWQSGLSNGARAGEVFGLIIAGWMTDRWGYRYTTMANLVAMIGFIFILFFAPNVQVLVVGQILCGGAGHSAAVLHDLYQCLLGHRPAAQLRHLPRNHQQARQLELAYPLRRPVGMAYPHSHWPDLCSRITVVARPSQQERRGAPLSCAPHETRSAQCQRRKHARHDRVHQRPRGRAQRGHIVPRLLPGHRSSPHRNCRHSLDRSDAGRPEPHGVLHLRDGAGRSGSHELPQPVHRQLRPRSRRRHRVVVLDVLRRKAQIHFSGLVCQFTILIVVGSLYFGRNNASLWATAGFLILFTFVYDFTVGPVTYSLISELSSTRLKTKTIVLARAAYNTSNIFVNVMTNYQLSSAAWNWSTRAAFFWAGTCFCCVIWVYFRLPEPKGRTYAELDMLFEQGVSARKFAKTKVDAYSDTNVLAKKSLDGAY
ncbi:Alpha-glucosides permease MPH3 like protein [Verticillium longisporum]|nr:Alpha-glucosides permease MPH3 like protein [Verticillium longisporum]